MSDPSDVKTLQPIGQFTLPPTPTDETIRRFSGNLWRTLQRETEAPLVSEDSLHAASTRKLNRIVPPTNRSPLGDDIDATFGSWSREREPSSWLQLIVLPPCDPNVLQTWASQSGHTVIHPPPRRKIIEGCDDGKVPEISGEGVIVIPRLEEWFLRHHSGLKLLRRLLDRLTRLERHCVIGCNSWAWGFLKKSVQADLALPHGVTLQAFDTDRLYAWFTQLIQSGEDEDKVFRSTKNGEDIFACQKGNGSTKSAFLNKLAARSLGVPWIAWHLWRRSLRVPPDDNEGIAEKFPDEQTWWVAELGDFQMPQNHVSTSLLALHALLLHHGLSADELRIVLPNVDESNLLAALDRAGLVQRDGDVYYCSPAAYPTIRLELGDAGFPLDRL